MVGFELTLNTCLQRKFSLTGSNLSRWKKEKYVICSFTPLAQLTSPFQRVGDDHLYSRRIPVTEKRTNVEKIK